MAEIIDMVRRSDGKTLHSIPLAGESRYEVYIEDGEIGFRPLLPEEVIWTLEGFLEVARLSGWKVTKPQE